MRQGEVKYTSILGELLLLSLDIIKEVSEDMFNNREVDTDLLAKAEVLLDSIAKQPKIALTTNAAKIISLFANQTLQTQGMEIYGLDNLVPQQAEQDFSTSNTDVPGNLVAGLSYFKDLILLLEAKIPYWDGRVHRTLPLALNLNKKLGSPEDPVQLTAALYMHDIGFAFLDEKFWNSQTKFTQLEIEKMQQHPLLAANLMSQMPEWADAREIALQHHERWDGGGYPHGIQGDKIRPGAQLLNVIDAFESMTHSRPDRQYKRSILRAMTEINNCSGTQFSPHMTALFNTVVRDTLTHKKG
jgi:HD-GYP domain-containing protein (c-di-GMP phosphodiesterase class II)